MYFCYSQVGSKALHGKRFVFFFSTLFPPQLDHLADDMLLKAGIDYTTRPMQLSIEEFSRLCDLYSEYCMQYPGLFEYYYRDQCPTPVLMTQEEHVDT